MTLSYGLLQWNSSLPSNYDLLGQCLDQLHPVDHNHRIKRAKKGEMPVVFLPQDSPEDCQGSESAMSAFGFLSFAMAVVNGVINAANNINNNNNNNNNNDNSNNQNNGNINLQSASNNANNENMATAGRRRTLKRLEELKKFATGNNKSKIRVGFKPIRIKHLSSSRKKRKESDLEAVAEEASLVALSYMELFLNVSKYQKSLQSQDCMARLFCCASKAASSIGNLGQRLALLFSQTTIQMLHLNPVLGEAHRSGSSMSSCQKFNCKMESSAKMKFCHQ